MTTIEILVWKKQKFWREKKFARNKNYGKSSKSQPKGKTKFDNT